MNIYVGNLAAEVTDEELQHAFEVYGTVNSASVIRDKVSGESRGFGFVEMPSSEEARAAIAGLNEQDFHGQILTVNEARSRSERRGGRGHPGGQRGYGSGKGGYGGSHKGKYSGGRGGRGGDR